MKASQIIVSEIKRNRSTKPDKETVLSATIDGIAVRVKLQDWDRLAVSLTGLTVRGTEDGPPEDENHFSRRCQHLADRLNYLEEPLKAIEIDGERKLAIVRSYPPRNRFNAVSYYEIVLDGNERCTNLVRKVRFSTSAKDMTDRVIIGHHLLTRLIDDLYENISQLRSSDK